MCVKFFGLLFPVCYFVKQNVIQWSNVTVGCKCSCSGSAGGKTATGDNRKTSWLMVGNELARKKRVNALTYVRAYTLTYEDLFQTPHKMLKLWIPLIICR